MTGLSRRTRLRTVSKKRAHLVRIYAKRRAVFLEAHPDCQAAPWQQITEADCTGRSTEVHHKAGRIGNLLLDESRWLATCHPCHDWITTHPAAAVTLGLSELRVGAA